MLFNITETLKKSTVVLLSKSPGAKFGCNFVRVSL